MAFNDVDAARTVERLNDRLRHRRSDISERIRYFKGRDGSLRFASDEFRDHFERRFKGFYDNWTAPVAQAPAERMNHTGVRLPGQSRPDEELRRVFIANEGERGLSEAILLMITASRSFALVSPEDGVTPRITFEHPEQTIVDEDPRSGVRRSGMVVWTDEEYDYATLYVPDGTWRLRRPTVEDPENEWKSTPLFGWQERPREDVFQRNPLGAVPLVELRNQSLLDDDPISDIAGVMAMQDAINLVWAYLLNALDYASLPQRVATGAEPPMVPILDSDGQVVGERPVELDQLIRDRILFLSDENAKISEWSAANLDAFSKVIEHAVEHVAAQTRTPPHYLVARMVNTAAESLTIAEAGLVSKTQERITYVNPALREIYRLVALSTGDKDKADALRAAKILWRDVQYRSEAQRADALQKKRAMGYPLEYILEQDGVDPDEIPRILQMRERELKMDPTAEIARSLADIGADNANDG